jgi:hypothetical protein
MRCGAGLGGGRGAALVSLSRSGHYRLAGGRVKDALRAPAPPAGLRPVFDRSARSRGVAAKRERDQWRGLRPRGS